MTTTTTTLPAHLVTGVPPPRGRYGPYGGRYVPETIMPALERLEKEAFAALNDPAFLSQLIREQRSFVGRPTPLTHCAGLTRAWGSYVWLKREDLAHTGAHKINNAIGQALLARNLGARRIVAETGAGQHGVAAAASASRVGLPCRVYMGAVDVARQRPNVDRMRLLGAEVVPVETGDQTLRSAISEALRDWVADPSGTYYLLGSVVGPHPYPWLVRRFQQVIGEEARDQLDHAGVGLPDVAVACVGGGSNAIGLFHSFVKNPEVALVGVEAGGDGSHHAATLQHGTPGVLHGSYGPLLQDVRGQVRETHSIAPGLDYPGVGPEHAQLRDLGRATYTQVTDTEAIAGLHELTRLEGILPALESAHALAGARRWAEQNPGSHILVGLSGRGDKDLDLINGASHS